jgi:hypothetical protein
MHENAPESPASGACFVRLYGWQKKPTRKRGGFYMELPRHYATPLPWLKKH